MSDRDGTGRDGEVVDEHLRCVGVSAVSCPRENRTASTGSLFPRFPTGPRALRRRDRVMAARVMKVPRSCYDQAPPAHRELDGAHPANIIVDTHAMSSCS